MKAIDFLIFLIRESPSVSIINCSIDFILSNPSFLSILFKIIISLYNTLMAIDLYIALLMEVL